MDRPSSTRERRKIHTRFWWKSQNERDQYKDLDIDGRVILKWILEKLSGLNVLHAVGLEQEQVEGSCDQGNEPSSSIKFREIFEQLNDRLRDSKRTPLHGVCWSAFSVPGTAAVQAISRAHFQKLLSSRTNITYLRKIVCNNVTNEIGVSVTFLGIYSEGSRFESRPRHQLYWLRFIVLFLTVSRKISGGVLHKDKIIL
jgi:hypothetical protein